jgi:hypothetical protein
MSFKIKIEPEAIDDIQSGIAWYNKQKPGLGKSFLSELKIHINLLKTNPFFQIRYDKVRCLPLISFPFMIHFTVNESESLVIIRAVFDTHRNPKIWKRRKK